MVNLEVNNHDNIYVEDDIDTAVLNSDAILILTDWDEYKNLNYEHFSKLMRKPAWVFDTRSVVNIEKIKNTDLKFWKIGYGISE